MVDERLKRLVKQYDAGEFLSGHVLIVDDDLPNLQVLSEVLEGDYTVHEANSGSEALAVAAREPIDVIITDQRMPEMTGVELLERVRRTKPDVAGIVLTAYTDSPAIMAAINRAQVLRFLTKPWSIEDVLAAVEQACDHVYQQRAIVSLVNLVAERNEALARALDEIQAAQQRILHLERLSTIGRLTAGITHDLRNFLASLALLNHELASQEISDDVREGVSIGLAGIRNLLSSLVTLNRFARGGELHVASDRLDIAEVLEDSITVMHMDLAFRRCNLLRQIEPGLPAIRGDRIRLVQVLVNLLRNAVEAGEPVRTVTIGAASTSDGRVAVFVEDDGPGIAPTIRKTVFDPFVTTKDQDGMGMGLYMARLIVESHGGQIAWSDRDGGGTRFELLLDRAR